MVLLLHITNTASVTRKWRRSSTYQELWTVHSLKNQFTVSIGTASPSMRRMSLSPPTPLRTRQNGSTQSASSNSLRTAAAAANETGASALMCVYTFERCCAPNIERNFALLSAVLFPIQRIVPYTTLRWSATYRISNGRDAIAQWHSVREQSAHVEKECINENNYKHIDEFIGIRQ